MTNDRPLDRRRWLCVAYAFPPINRSGTHRTLGFVRHLHRLGWDATVITADPRGESCDAALSLRVPASTKVVRTFWVDAVEWLKRPATLFRLPRNVVRPGAGARSNQDRRAWGADPASGHRPASGRRSARSRFQAPIGAGGLRWLQTPTTRMDSFGVGPG